MLRVPVFVMLTHVLVACTPVARYADLPPAYGNIKAISEADLRAALAAEAKFVRSHPLGPGPGLPTYGLPITFVRVIDNTAIELHYKSYSDSVTEHYSMIERKAGRWEPTTASIRDVHQNSAQ